MKEILWVIASPKYEVKIKFTTTRFGKWLLDRLMKRRKIIITPIKTRQLRGQHLDKIYVDEFR